MLKLFFGPTIKELRGMLADQLIYWAICLDKDNPRIVLLCEALRPPVA